MGLVVTFHLSDIVLGIFISLMVGMLWFKVSYVVGLVAFWLEETWVLRVMFVTVSQFLSGAIVPLEFFPDWMSRWLNYSPFPYLTYVPVQVFLSKYNDPFSQALLIILVWYGVVSLIGHLVWRQGIKNYTAAGV